MMGLFEACLGFELAANFPPYSRYSEITVEQLWRKNKVKKRLKIKLLWKKFGGKISIIKNFRRSFSDFST